MAATKGLPQVSSFLCMPVASWLKARASSTEISCSMRSRMPLRSAPAMKAGLPEVMMAPLTASSAAILSMASFISASHSGETTFMGRPGSSRVMRAMPSCTSYLIWLVMVRIPVAVWGGRREASHPLDDGGGGEAVTGAQGDEAGVEIAALQLVEEDAGDHGAGGTEGVAEGDGAAVDVDLAVVEVHLGHEVHHHRGEGLVDFHQVDVGHGHAGALQQLVDAGHGAVEHDGLLTADGSEGADFGAGFQARRLAEGLAPHQHHGGAVDDAAGVAGGVDVVHFQHGGVALHGHGVEAVVLAEGGEGGLEAGEGLGGGIGAAVFVVVEQHLA